MNPSSRVIAKPKRSNWQTEKDKKEKGLARKTVEEMVADGFREVGELVLVFAILDRILDGHITTAWTLVAIGVSAFFFLAGLYIERRRPDE